MIRKRQGFTLIELLVVIAVIGVLSSVALVSLSEARERAKIAAAKAELNQLSTALVSAQIQAGKSLKEITGSSCSGCSCSVRDMKNIEESDPCYRGMKKAIEAVNEASGGMMENYIDNFRDPWGSPYRLDENELERSSDPCIQDHLRSNGPDGIRYTSDLGEQLGLENDDIVVYIPFTTGQCVQ